MKISDLKSAMDFVVKNFNEHKIIPLFQAFNNVVNQVLRNRQNQSISPQRDQLYKALREIDLDLLTHQERKILEAYNAFKYLGENLIKEIDSILHDEKFDPVGVADKIKALFEETNKFYNLAQSLLTNLYPFKKTPELKLSSDKAVIQITFEQESEIDNIVQLNHWIEIWQRLIRAFCMIYDVPPEEAEIVYIEKINPLVLDIATFLGIIYALGMGADLVLDKMEKYLTLKKISLEIDNLKLQNEVLKKELSKEEEKFKEKSSEEIAREIIKKSAKQKLEDGEVVSAVNLAIKDMFDFLDQGGKIDYYLPERKGEEEPDKETILKQIDQLFSRVRQLEDHVQEIKALPEIKQKNNDDGPP